MIGVMACRVVRSVIQPVIGTMFWSVIHSRPSVSRAIRALMLPRLMLPSQVSRQVLPVLNSIQHRANELPVGKIFALSRAFRRPFHRVRLDCFLHRGHR